ncbi:MAG: hypothetical protein IKS54_08300 [Erysipelotrichaceae bacterium]|nr:hypothetical protein [Erysipelotrichaceae bacterium]
MFDYQIRYIENVKKILELRDVTLHANEGFDRWYEGQLEAKEEMKRLKKENNEILGSRLFPVLDDLYNANDEVISSLEDFADQLMDWRSNLDCGVYVLIHEALLSMYKVLKNRDKTIRELYKLGMGLYYQNRMIQGTSDPISRRIYFENEMVFTEGASYLRYFDQIEDEETKGYIIRCLANISIATIDRKRRISTTARVLNIIQDPYYRNLAPGLPWDVYLRRTYQQMSANRNTLSKGDLTNEELALVMEACQIIFEPEKDNKNPNIRWLWPYYEMEYSCGFANLKTTLDRMEKLIEETPYDQYDESGLYGNVQLPIYYGRLLRDNPQLLEKPRYISFLHDAYEKMMHTLLSFPNEKIDEFFFYDITLLTYTYFETEGVRSYLDVTGKLMGRIAGQDFIRTRRIGEILQVFCDAIFSNDPDYFDEIPFISEISDQKEKRSRILEYAKSCGNYFDFGFVAMNMAKITSIRDFFDREFDIFKLHTIAGYENLKERKSTEHFADIARGHHSDYDGNGGYPEDYVRIESKYRMMCDVAAVVSYLAYNYDGDMDEIVSFIEKQSRKKFSPIVTSYLLDPKLTEKIEEILIGERKQYYQELYDQITGID